MGMISNVADYFIDGCGLICTQQMLAKLEYGLHP